MAGFFEIHETRYRFVAAPLSLAFTALDAAAWAVGTATKALLYERPSLSGLEEQVAPNPAVRTRVRGRGKGIRAPIQKGEFVTLHPFNAKTGTGGDELYTLLGKIYGGTSTPTAASATLDSAGTHTAQRLFSTGLGAKVALYQAVLVVSATGAYVPQVRPIAAKDTDQVDLAFDLDTVPADGDTIYLGRTVFPDEDATFDNVEFAFIGHDENGPAQKNVVGCRATKVEFAQLNLAGDDLPVVRITWKAGRWRWEPTATQATRDTTTAPAAADAIAHQGVGHLWICDRGSYLGEDDLQFFFAGDLSFDPGIAHKPLMAPGNENALQGYKLAPGTSMLSVKVYQDEGTEQPIPTLLADYENQTAKQTLIQIGDAPDNCIAIHQQNAFIDKMPTEVEADGYLAIDLEMHAEEGTVTTSDQTRAEHFVYFFESA